MADKTNVAKGTDRVAVQVGTVHNGKASKTDKQTGAAGDVETRNVKTGNATVGKQADEIHGGLTFTSKRRR